MDAFGDFALQLHEKDNVAVVKKRVTAGMVLADASLACMVRSNIPPGHKLALLPIQLDEPVIKYGEIIGFATANIAPGDHVHTHNATVKDFSREYRYGVNAVPVEIYPEAQWRFFQGYLRNDGRVGTRNYLAVISSVNCSASVSRHICDHFRNEAFRKEFPQVDGVAAFTHKTGCGIQPGEPLQQLQRVLMGLVRHPNIFGCVLIGLGCEVNHLDLLSQEYGLDSPGKTVWPPILLNIQTVGSMRKTIAAGIAAVSQMLPQANACRRSRQPAGKLVMATNCGGSDGLSGITANPALGCAADELVKHGGTAVLAETPEIYGAEHLLVQRAISREVGDKLIDRIHWWENHVKIHQATIDNNPSLGNKAGGITTIYEKSLGAVAKGGHSPLMAVYKYAEPVRHAGFCFMDTPGLDPVSMTGLVAGGCNIAVFTTGRGSVYGCKPTPCIKVSTNTPLFQHMQEDMDLNAGSIMDGLESVPEVGRRIFEQILRVASGELTKSELAGVGDEEFAPWILGPTF